MEELLADICEACAKIDASGIPFKLFQPGVGPYGEPQLVKGIATHLNAQPEYAGKAVTKRTPDLLIQGAWAIEVKIARPFGDNGRQAENWSVNLLHPYPGNVSVFGDCLKLSKWEGSERRAAIVVGYEHDPAEISLTPLLDAFDAIAGKLLPFPLHKRIEVARYDLRHPVHRVVRVVGWEVPRGTA